MLAHRSLSVMSKLQPSFLHELYFGCWEQSTSWNSSKICIGCAKVKSPGSLPLQSSLAPLALSWPGTKFCYWDHQSHTNMDFLSTFTCRKRKCGPWSHKGFTLVVLLYSRPLNYSSVAQLLLSLCSRKELVDMDDRLARVSLSLASNVMYQSKEKGIRSRKRKKN